MEKSEITAMVNECFKGVDESEFGPMFQYPDPSNPMNKQVNQLAFGVFTIVLTGMMRGAKSQ